MKLRRLAAAALCTSVAMAICVFAGACGDDDEDTGSTDRHDVPDVYKASLPDAGGPGTGLTDSAALDANIDALFPEAWDRSKSARDAALPKSDRYCSQPDANVGQFCWDFTFDDGITAWQDVLADGGKHELVGGGSGDPLRALQSTIFADAGPEPHWVSLRYTINIDDVDASSGITLSFSFHASSVATAAIIGALQIPTPEGPTLRGLAVYPGGCSIIPGVPCLGENTFDGGDLKDRRPFDVKKWYRTRIHLQPSGIGTDTVTWASTITVGDKVVAQHETGGLPNTKAFPTSVNLFVGAFDTTAQGSTVVEIDDVFVE